MLSVLFDPLFRLINFKTGGVTLDPTGYCVSVCMDKLIQTLSGNWLNNALPLARMSELSEGWAHSQQGFDRINHLANG